MTSRAPYHHGRLREALAEAAVAAVRADGPDGLVVRRLARDVGVSHNAAYRHFADRAALVDAVADVALAGMVAAMRARLLAVDEDDAASRARLSLGALGAGYVDFAIAEPGLFRTLFTSYPEIPPTEDDAADPFGMLNAALDDLVEVGYLDPLDRPGAEITCWAAVHGFAVLSVEGPLRGVRADDREAALRSMLARLDIALAGGTSLLD